MFILPLLLTAVAALPALTGGAPGFIASSFGLLSGDGLLDAVLVLVGLSSVSSISAPKIANVLDAALSSVATDLILFDPRMISLAVINCTPPISDKALLDAGTRPLLAQLGISALAMVFLLVVTVVILPPLKCQVAKLSARRAYGAKGALNALAAPQATPDSTDILYEHTILLSLVEHNAYIVSSLLPPSSLVPEQPTDIATSGFRGVATAAPLHDYAIYEPTVSSRIRWEEADIELFSSGGFANARIVPHDGDTLPIVMHGRLVRHLDCSDDTEFPTHLYFLPTGPNSVVQKHLDDRRGHISVSTHLSSYASVSEPLDNG